MPYVRSLAHVVSDRIIALIAECIELSGGEEVNMASIRVESGGGSSSLFLCILGELADSFASCSHFPQVFSVILPDARKFASSCKKAARTRVSLHPCRYFRAHF